MNPLSIKEVAELTGLSLRALRYYDQLGLVSPMRQDNGYRAYLASDLERLQQVLFYRELGMELDEIGRILSRPTHDVLHSLTELRGRLAARRDELETLLHTLDLTIARKQRGHTMSKNDFRQMFDGFDPSQHEAEAEARWGDTEAYAQSQQRAASYGPEQWAEIKEEAAQIYADAYALAQAGTSPDASEAHALARRHQDHLSRWFYDCAAELHCGLARMYVQDERFQSAIDAHGEGTAALLSEAILSLHRA